MWFMKIIQEQISHPAQSFSLLRLEQDAFAYQRHRHAHLELTWIEQGSGMRFMGNHVGPFGPGDLVLVGPHLAHAWLSGREHAGQAHIVTVLQIAPELLLHSGLPEMRTLDQLVKRAGGGLQIHGSLHAAVTGTLQQMLALPSHLQQLAGAIYLLGLLNETSGDVSALQEGSAKVAAEVPRLRDRPEQERRIDRVIGWISQQYHQPLAVAQAAALVHVTPTAFSRFFRREVGKNFTDYVNDLRCSEACLMLLHGDQPVSIVAQACGFDTLSNFNHQFRRRYGVSPRAYRRGPVRLMDA